jgi:hypothetical protein
MPQYRYRVSVQRFRPGLAYLLLLVKHRNQHTTSKPKAILPPTLYYPLGLNAPDLWGHGAKLTGFARQ